MAKSASVKPKAASAWSTSANGCVDDDVDRSEGVEFEFYNLHADAGSGEGVIEAREGNYAQLAAHLALGPRARRTSSWATPT